MNERNEVNAKGDKINPCRNNGQFTEKHDEQTKPKFLKKTAVPPTSLSRKK